MKVEDIVELYIKYIFTQHRVLKKIISDRDLRFIVVFKKYLQCYKGYI
jgi:hypothetical protein